MNLRRNISNLIQALELLPAFNSIYDTSMGSDKPYLVKGIKKLKEAVIELEETGYFQGEISELRRSFLYQTNEDSLRTTSSLILPIERLVNELIVGLRYLVGYIAQLPKLVATNNIDIRLPETKDFDHLSKVANEFKKVIDIPVSDLPDGEPIEIISAEPGSIWLTVALHTGAAIGLVGAICKAAVYLKQKNAAANTFIEYAKGLHNHNDYLKAIQDGQKKLIDEYVATTTAEISNDFYQDLNIEKQNRLKLAIETMENLYQKGAIVLPSANDLALQKQFPTMSEIQLLTSGMNQIENPEKQ
ncbi:MAG: hypothetical protein JST70_18800 [Bacteroidetes bacterium]|nr:hypothetical protein [Bacteroidota bacterium]